MPTELQWHRLSDLINGLPQIEWYVYLVDVTGDFLYVHARSIRIPENVSLFILDAEGDFLQ